MRRGLKNEALENSTFLSFQKGNDLLMEETKKSADVSQKQQFYRINFQKDAKKQHEDLLSKVRPIYQNKRTLEQYGNCEFMYYLLYIVASLEVLHALSQVFWEPWTLVLAVALLGVLDQAHSRWFLILRTQIKQLKDQQAKVEKQNKFVEGEFEKECLNASFQRPSIRAVDDISLNLGEQRKLNMNALDHNELSDVCFKIEESKRERNSFFEKRRAQLTNNLTMKNLHQQENRSIGNQLLNTRRQSIMVAGINSKKISSFKEEKALFNMETMLQFNGLFLFLFILLLAKLKLLSQPSLPFFNYQSIMYETPMTVCRLLSTLGIRQVIQSVVSQSHLRMFCFILFFSCFAVQQPSDSFLTQLLSASVTGLACFEIYTKMELEEDEKFAVYSGFQDLSHTTKKQEELFQNLPFGVGLLNIRKINRFNENFMKILGFKNSIQLFKMLKQIKRKKDQLNGNTQLERNRACSLLEDIINISRNSKAFEFQDELEYGLEKIDPKTKEKFHRFLIVTLQSLPLHDETNVLLCIRDITKDKKIMEVRMINSLRNMMFKSFTHEIRTPLNSTISFLDLSKQILDKQKQKYGNLKEIKQLDSYLLQIESGIVILQNNLNDLIDYQMAEAGTLNIIKKEFDLRETFMEIRRVMRAQLTNKNVKFQCFFDNRVPKTVESDQDRLKRIVLNLLLNAQKYTVEGSIKFTIKYVRKKERKDSKQVASHMSQKLSSNQFTEFVRFEISDSGVGIPKEKLPYIFNLFESDIGELENNFQNEDMQNSSNGAKIGLPICQHICQKIGSQIKVSSIQGTGTKFWFQLPIKKHETFDYSNFFNYEMKEESKSEENNLVSQNGENKEIFQFMENDEMFESDENSAIEEEYLSQNRGGMTSKMGNENLLLTFCHMGYQQQQMIAEQENEGSQEESEDEEIKNEEDDMYDSNFNMSNNLGLLNNQRSAKKPRKNTRLRAPTKNKLEIKITGGINDQSREGRQSRMQSVDFSAIRSRSILSDQLRRNKMNLDSPLIQEISPDRHDDFKAVHSGDSSIFQDKRQLEDEYRPRASSLVDMNGLRMLRWKSSEGRFKRNLEESKQQSTFEQGENKPKTSFQRLSDPVRQEGRRAMFEGLAPTSSMIIFSQKSMQMLQGYNYNKTALLQNRNKCLNSFFASDSQEYFSHLVEFGCECAQALVVDDIDINRYVIQEILQSKFGLPVEEANNGKECLQLIKKKSLSECCSRFKLIFMDFQMPIMNGLQATQKIKKYIQQGKIQPGVQIIAYTAFNGEEKTCIDAGMDYFMPKPASFSMIRDILKQINNKFDKEAAEKEFFRR